jgi:hypothetical protein
MAINFTRLTPHTLTLWPVTGTDGFGALEFGPPVSFAGKYERKMELFRSVTGDELRSSAIAYAPRAGILVGSYLALGMVTTTDPLTVEGAWKIQGLSESVSVDGTQTLAKLFL